MAEHTWILSRQQIWGHYHIVDSFSDIGSKGIFYRKQKSQLTTMVKALVL